MKFIKRFLVILLAALFLICLLATVGLYFLATELEKIAA